ncbi:hypothetical protein J6TS2_21920 [Heyndrickxia sporothermodurans]|nr:hypothetical protein J6TS2_21920 [Heyndrickxia sporothermodurans]
MQNGWMKYCHKITRVQERYPNSVVDMSDRWKKFSSDCGYLELNVDMSILEEKVND